MILPGVVFAWCSLFMGQERGKTVRIGERDGIGEHTPKFHGEAKNELQPVITSADVCFHSPNAPLYPKKWILDLQTW